MKVIVRGGVNFYTIANGGIEADALKWPDAQQIVPNIYDDEGNIVSETLYGFIRKNVITEVWYMMYKNMNNRYYPDIKVNDYFWIMTNRAYNLNSGGMYFCDDGSRFLKNISPWDINEACCSVKLCVMDTDTENVADITYGKSRGQKYLYNIDMYCANNKIGFILNNKFYQTKKDSDDVISGNECTKFKITAITDIS